MPSYIDFRYPGIFNLNRSAEMPIVVRPAEHGRDVPERASRALADPLVARMKEEQARAETAKSGELTT